MSTDLATKFDTLETLLSTQHSETMTTLNALLAALGAPPPSPGATLADVVGALNQLAFMVAGLRQDMAAQHGAQLLQLQGVNTTLNLINENASWNTKQTLLALAALDPCKPCEIPSYELPPIDATPVVVDQEHCKRVQALLYAILRFTTKLDIISSLGAGFNTETIKSAFTEILTEIGAAGNLSINLPSFSELLTLVAACVEYIASNIFAGNDLQSSFQSIKSDLIQPLYEAATASAGIAAYRAGIDASSLPTPIKRVLKAIGYIALFNLHYGNAPVNTAGFDGTICAPAQTECIQIQSQVVSHSYFGSTNAIVWTGQLGITGETSDPRGTTSNSPIWFRPPTQVYVTLLDRGSATVQLYAQGSQDMALNVPIVLNIGGDAGGYAYQIGSSTPFTIEVCPGLPPS